MKIFLWTALLFLSFSQNSFSTLQVPPRCYKPQTQLSCQFYFECAEAHFQCGDEGYAIQYGEKYCKRFISMREAAIGNPFGSKSLSHQGILWRNRTLLCLQNAIVSKMAPPAKVSCEQLSDFAFSSHVGCYTQKENSFCGLPAIDVATVIMEPDLKDLLSVNGLEQGFEVFFRCLPEWTKDSSPNIPLPLAMNTSWSFTQDNTSIDRMVAFQKWMEQIAEKSSDNERAIQITSQINFSIAELINLSSFPESTTKTQNINDLIFKIKQQVRKLQTSLKDN